MLISKYHNQVKCYSQEAPVDVCLHQLYVTGTVTGSLQKKVSNPAAWIQHSWCKASGASFSFSHFTAAPLVGEE